MTAQNLQPGDMAPDFTLVSGDGQSITLSQLCGRPVVIYFYPKDDTPGCTKQACDFRDSAARIRAAGIALYGISRDSLASHRKFTEKFQLNFPLLSDETGAVCNAYGVWKQKSMMGKKYMGIERTTFLIDTTGKIAQIWSKVSVTDHVDMVLAEAEKLSKDKAA